MEIYNGKQYLRNDVLTITLYNHDSSLRINMTFKCSICAVWNVNIIVRNGRKSFAYPIRVICLLFVYDAFYKLKYSLDIVVLDLYEAISRSEIVAT